MNAALSGPDELYARGELSREDWLRLRGSGPDALARPPPAHARANTGRGGSNRVPLGLIAVAGVALAVILVLWAVVGGLTIPSSPSVSYGAVDRLSPSGLSALNTSATTGLAHLSNNSVWFPAGPVHLVVYASPSDHDMTFVIQGLVNPSLHLSSGSRLTVTVVNLDPDMYHNWALSRGGPPFGSMPMMAHGMMMAMAMLGPAHGNEFWGQAASFTVTSGSYWYFCTYPGHAAEGMYGSFDVS